MGDCIDFYNKITKRFYGFSSFDRKLSYYYVGSYTKRNLDMFWEIKLEMFIVELRF